GCDLSHKTGITHGESTYIEYRLGGAGVTMHYKRMSKMNDTTLRGRTATAPDANIRMIDKDRAAMNVLNQPGATMLQEVYHLTTDLRFGYTTDITLNVTKRNKGLLHSAKGSGIHTFTAP